MLANSISQTSKIHERDAALQIGHYEYRHRDLLGEGFSSKVYRGTDRRSHSMTVR